MRTAIVLALLLLLPSTGDARLVTLWTYEALYDEADLVVIAKPVWVSQSDEVVTLQNFNPKASVYEIRTSFSVRVVLKGASTETFRLLHFKPADQYQFAMAGPHFVQFDPAHRHSYLMFLKPNEHGSYSPATGQLDAADAIIKLESSVQ